MKACSWRIFFVIAVLIATALILSATLQGNDTRAQTSIIPESLAREQALVYSMDDGLHGGAVTPPSTVYGQVMTYGEAIRFVTGRLLDVNTEAYQIRNKAVWLLVLEGKFIEHVPPSADGRIPAKDVSHSQMVIILDGDTGEMMEGMLLSPHTKLSVANLPILKESGGAIPALPTHEPIIIVTPYPTWTFIPPLTQLPTLASTSAEMSTERPLPSMASPTPSELPTETPLAASEMSPAP